MLFSFQRTGSNRALFDRQSLSNAFLCGSVCIKQQSTVSSFYTISHYGDTFYMEREKT